MPLEGSITQNTWLQIRQLLRSLPGINAYAHKPQADEKGKEKEQTGKIKGSAKPALSAQNGALKSFPPEARYLHRIRRLDNGISRADL